MSDDDSGAELETAGPRPQGQGLPRKKWTEEEHLRLAEIIERTTTEEDFSQGRIRWAYIATELGNGRTSKQCRERWVNMRPEIRKGHWHQDEEECLARTHAYLGPAWSQIGREEPLRRRSENAIKSHWHALMRAPALAGRPANLLTSYMGLIKSGWHAGMDTLDLAQQILDAAKAVTQDPEAQGGNLAVAMDRAASRDVLAPHLHPEQVVEAIQAILTEPFMPSEIIALPKAPRQQVRNLRRRKSTAELTSVQSDPYGLELALLPQLPPLLPGSAARPPLLACIDSNSSETLPAGISGLSLLPGPAEGGSTHAPFHPPLRVSSSATNLRHAAHVEFSGGPKPMDFERSQTSQGLAPVAWAPEPQQLPTVGSSAALLAALQMAEADAQQPGWRGEVAVPPPDAHPPALPSPAGPSALGRADSAAAPPAAGFLALLLTDSPRKHPSVSARTTGPIVPAPVVPNGGTVEHAEPPTADLFPGLKRTRTANSAEWAPITGQGNGSAQHEAHAAVSDDRWVAEQATAVHTGRSRMAIPPGVTHAAAGPMSVPNPCGQLAPTHTTQSFDNITNSYILSSTPRSSPLKRPANAMPSVVDFAKGGKVPRGWEVAGPWSAPAMHAGTALPSRMPASAADALTTQAPLSYHSARPGASLTGLTMPLFDVREEECFSDVWHVLLSETDRQAAVAAAVAASPLAVAATAVAAAAAAAAAPTSSGSAGRVVAVPPEPAPRTLPVPPVESPRTVAVPPEDAMSIPVQPPEPLQRAASVRSSPALRTLSLPLPQPSPRTPPAPQQPRRMDAAPPELSRGAAAAPHALVPAQEKREALSSAIRRFTDGSVSVPPVHDDGCIDVPEGSFMHLEPKSAASVKSTVDVPERAMCLSTHPGANQGLASLDILRSAGLSNDSTHGTSGNRPSSGASVSTPSQPSAAHPAGAGQEPGSFSAWAGDTATTQAQRQQAVAQQVAVPPPEQPVAQVAVPPPEHEPPAPRQMPVPPVQQQQQQQLAVPPPQQQQLAVPPQPQQQQQPAQLVVPPQPQQLPSALPRVLSAPANAWGITAPVQQPTLPIVQPVWQLGGATPNWGPMAALQQQGQLAGMPPARPRTTMCGPSAHTSAPASAPTLAPTTLPPLPDWQNKTWGESSHMACLDLSRTAPAWEPATSAAHQATAAAAAAAAAAIAAAASGFNVPQQRSALGAAAEPSRVFLDLSDLAAIEAQHALFSDEMWDDLLSALDEQ